MALTDNLVAYYKLDGNSNDSVGSANGTDTNITYGASYGKINQGANFNGSSSAINLGNNSVIKPTGVFSAALWFSQPTTNNTRVLFESGYRDDVTPDWCWFNIHSGSDKVHFQLVDRKAGYNDTVTASGTSNITNNGKHLVIITFDSSKVGRIYVDNSLEGSANFTRYLTYTKNARARIGCEGRDGGDNLQNGAFFSGDIDEVAFWDGKVLDSTERSQLWNGGAGFQWPFSTKTMSVRVGGVWKSATPYVKIAGVWKPATPFVKVSGVWK